MKSLKFGLLFYMLTLLPAHSFSNPEIKEINSIQEVKTIFEQASQRDLFVFDVDDVILEPSDPAQQSLFYKNHELKKIVDDFNAFIKNKNSPQEYKKLIFSRIKLKSKIQPVEKALIDSILDIQKRKIKVIALTAYNSGRFGIIKRLEEWRYDQLLSLGLDFRSSFELQDIRFDELLKTKHAAKYKAENGEDPRPTVFYQGVLCTRYPKGVVLKAFLEKIGCNPACVYFFDDKRQNVESVVQEMKKIGIKCQGFVYKAVTHNWAMSDLDIEVIKFQYELMKKRDDYVGYFEAKDILELQKGLNKELTKSIRATL